jgi:hypothetical protein
MLEGYRTDYLDNVLGSQEFSLRLMCLRVLLVTTVPLEISAVLRKWSEL